jgi:hypothetical protein
MTKKESLAYDIADYMCHPADSIEIGGLSQQLLQIIQNITRKDKKLRDLAVEYLATFIEEGDFNVDEYDGNVELAIKDYDRTFFK